MTVFVHSSPVHCGKLTRLTYTGRAYRYTVTEITGCEQVVHFYLHCIEAILTDCV